MGALVSLRLEEWIWHIKVLFFLFMLFDVMVRSLMI